MNKAELLDALCRRCINYEMCKGTGCQPIKDVAMLYELAEGKSNDKMAEAIREAEFCSAEFCDRYTGIICGACRNNCPQAIANYIEKMGKTNEKG